MTIAARKRRQRRAARTAARRLVRRFDQWDFDHRLKLPRRVRSYVLLAQAIALYERLARS